MTNTSSILDASMILPRALRRTPSLSTAGGRYVRGRSTRCSRDPPFSDVLPLEVGSRRQLGSSGSFATEL
eukprot:8869865-Heterocapsa_arctica.AAC.1